jgi:hypothetical protein
LQTGSPFWLRLHRVVMVVLQLAHEVPARLAALCKHHTDRRPVSHLIAHSWQNTQIANETVLQRRKLNFPRKTSCVLPRLVNYPHTRRQCSLKRIFSLKSASPLSLSLTRISATNAKREQLLTAQFSLLLKSARALLVININKSAPTPQNLFS